MTLPFVLVYVDDLFLSLCSTCIKTCPNNNYQCRRLSDTIKYQTLALPKDLPTQIDLIRLVVVVTNDQTQHRNSYFSIKDREEAENVSYYCELLVSLLWSLLLLSMIPKPVLPCNSVIFQNMLLKTKFTHQTYK